MPQWLTTPHIGLHNHVKTLHIVAGFHTIWYLEVCSNKLGENTIPALPQVLQQATVFYACMATTKYTHTLSTFPTHIIMPCSHSTHSMIAQLYYWASLYTQHIPDDTTLTYTTQHIQDSTLSRRIFVVVLFIGCLQKFRTEM